MRPQQGETDLYEKPVFDIEVRAQKQNVYTRMSPERNGDSVLHDGRVQSRRWQTRPLKND